MEKNMAKLETVWLGDQKSEVTHLQSGEKIITDAPSDIQGKGRYFSPTDLLAASLGSCIMTGMAAYAEAHGMDLTGTRLITDKIMSANPRRVGEIIIDIYFTGSFDEKQRMVLKRVAETCPVGKSLCPEVKQTVRFHFTPASETENQEE